MSSYKNTRLSLAALDQMRTSLESLENAVEFMPIIADQANKGWYINPAVIYTRNVLEGVAQNFKIMINILEALANDGIIHE